MSIEEPNSPSRQQSVRNRQRSVKMCREMAQHGHAKDYAVKYCQGSDRLRPCHPFLPNRNTTPHILSEGMDGGEKGIEGSHVEMRCTTCMPHDAVACVIP